MMSALPYTLPSVDSNNALSLHFSVDGMNALHFSVDGMNALHFRMNAVQIDA